MEGLEGGDVGQLGAELGGTCRGRRLDEGLPDFS